MFPNVLSVVMNWLQTAVPNAKAYVSMRNIEDDYHSRAKGAGVKVFRGRVKVGSVGALGVPTL